MMMNCPRCKKSKEVNKNGTRPKFVTNKETGRKNKIRVQAFICWDCGHQWTED